LHLIELGGIGPGRIGGGDNFAGFGREQLGDGRQRSRVAADRPTLERRYVSVSRLLSDRARPRFSSPRQAGDRDPPLPVERDAGRSGWLTGNASHAEPSKIISEYRNDGCRRLAAIGTRSIKTPRSTGGHMSETKREYAASYRKSPMHTRFKKG